jgi:hypothetical protein
MYYSSKYSEISFAKLLYFQGEEMIYITHLVQRE